MTERNQLYYKTTSQKQGGRRETADMWRVTHQVNLPTVALGVLWIIHSAATTMYVPWQNGRQRAALASVADHVEQTLQLQDQLTDLSRLPLGEDSSASRQATEQSISATLLALNDSIDDPLSQKHLTSLRNRFESERRQNKTVVSSVLAQLIDDCQQLIRAQQQQFITIVDQRSRTDMVIMIVRAVLLALGLLVGIGLAMWIARGLRQSLSEMSVTLRGAEGDLRMDLGRIDIVSQGSAGELNLLESQVQRIVQNVHRVVEELQQTRQEVARAERLAAVGELAAGVAHEIRNPLTSVKLLIQRAAERQPVHSLSEEHLQVLLEEVSRIESTVQGLLDFAKPEKSERAACSLGGILEGTLRLLDGQLQKRHIRIVRKEAEPIPLVCGDARMIQQVLVNLMLNAIEFMPDGGDLTIRLSTDETRCRATLEIEDAGPGISPAVINRLFEPFVTTRSNGSGLGLAISRRMIEEQGGTLAGRNSPQGGAVFCIHLPLVEQLTSSTCELAHVDLGTNER